MFYTPRSTAEALKVISELVAHIDRGGRFGGPEEVAVPVSALRLLAKDAEDAPPPALDAQARDALEKAIAEGRGADAEAFHRLWLAMQDKKST